ncbi:MAG: LbetaH domain-containing protein [Planctomycetota bacterium]|jgi:putative colanic acid biosynthesis acetyltransferase WcaF
MSGSSPDTPVRAEDRHRSPFTTREKLGRLAWSIVQATLFRLSFHNWYRWRVFLLRRFGAAVHPTCRIRRTVRVECPWNLAMGRNGALGDGVIAYCLGPVTLGDRVSVSQHAHLCAGTHDYDEPDMPLRRPPIDVHHDAWIAADAFVGPGVTVGAGAILGARGCAFDDLEPWTIHGGNPARPLKPRRRPDPA